MIPDETPDTQGAELTEAEVARRMEAMGHPLPAPEGATLAIEATDAQEGNDATAKGLAGQGKSAPPVSSPHLPLLRYLAEVVTSDPKALGGSATVLAIRKLLKQAERAAKKVASASRADRWADACSTAREGLEELAGLKEEFEEWQGNLPENLQQTALGEKLQVVCDLDLDSAISAIDEAEGLDLPLGFGRD